jgi:SAM-dependent methyltransferase
MVAAARARTARDSTRASFIVADAQDYPFEPGCFHMIISRFGVMFFADFIRAFANLRRAAKSGAELRFIAWRTPEENSFMTVTERAAAPFIPNLPTRKPDVPGPFAFADGQRLHRILEESGWTEIDIQPLDVPCTFAEKELMGYVTRIGPLGQVLHQVDDRTRSIVIDRVREAFEPYVRGAEVHFTAACWTVGARA